MADFSKPPADATEPFAASAKEPFDHRRLCHLLRRATLAVNRRRLEQFARKSPSEIVNSLTGYDPADDRPYSDLLQGLSGMLSPIYNAEDAQKWWLMRILDSPRPLQE